eukprot:6101272-Amphidinium_carterae.1
MLFGHAHESIVGEPLPLVDRPELLRELVAQNVPLAATVSCDSMLRCDPMHVKGHPILWLDSACVVGLSEAVRAAGAGDMLRRRHDEGGLAEHMVVEGHDARVLTCGHEGLSAAEGFVLVIVGDRGGG